MHLSDAQWDVVKPWLREKTRGDGRGRPWRDARAVLDGVLWILRTGARWQDWPREDPPYQTCHRVSSNGSEKAVWSGFCAL
jgi:transposase